MVNAKLFYAKGKDDETEEPELTIKEFEFAAKDFTTQSTEGIKLFKSSVEWGDVGGLNEVKQMLRETFEFPTKYAKLFQKSPIKLRSGYEILIFYC